MPMVECANIHRLEIASNYFKGMHFLCDFWKRFIGNKFAPSFVPISVHFHLQPGVTVALYLQQTEITANPLRRSLAHWCVAVCECVITTSARHPIFTSEPSVT